MKKSAKKQASPVDEFAKLVDVVAQLRGPQGCPWDQAQDQKTLVQFAIEEAYELAEAIESGQAADVQEELGDFLFQVVLQAQVAADEGQFNLYDVIQKLNKKMISRHPHVFAKTKVSSIADVWKNWEKIKNAEKPKAKPIFSYPHKMPALQAAHKIGVKTQSYRFDWEHASEVMLKVKEEMKELKVALKDFNKKKSSQNLKELEHEIGDVLFSVSQLARHCGLESEQALRACNRRFAKRFSKTLEFSKKSKDEFIQLSIPEKEKLWKKAKKSVG
jgi:tetrapyrrole methylase family protein/MazG family protein